LLELLLVLALVATLTAFALAAYGSLAEAAAITTGANLLSDALLQARQDAIAQNITVEVRFYDVPSSTDSTPAYRAVQLHVLQATASPPLYPPLLLPTGMALDPTVQYSPLLGGLASEMPTPDASDSRLNSGTRVVRFFPDGSTDLDPTTMWFMTLRSIRSSTVGFPRNWACLTIDPPTGFVQIYRP